MSMWNLVQLVLSLVIQGFMPVAQVLVIVNPYIHISGLICSAFYYLAESTLESGLSLKETNDELQL